MQTTTSASPVDDHAHRRREVGECRSRQRGRVAWFDAEKGFGFLTPGRGGPAVFCDYTAIATPGYKTLRAGQRVVFTVTDSGRGPEAVEVLTCDEPEVDPAAPHSRSWAWARKSRCRRVSAA
ncbi:cold-shock protein [Nocardia mangyaensis]|uniref:cold-shock protein n=1 Tax=Nocardia mangyaensis TaxID=2213200 RepID=UPI003F5810BF